MNSSQPLVDTHKDLQPLNSDTQKALNMILDHLANLRGERADPRYGHGQADRSRNTVSRILTAARDVFTEQGHAGLSLRKVAESADIAVGNLTYHFPSKDALIKAMLREALADYIKAHLDQFHASRDSALDILLNVVEFYIRSARTSHRFFFQIWGYAASSEEALLMVRELYQPIGRFIYYLTRAANPKLNDAELRQATLQIFALEEGYKLFIGLGPDNSSAIVNAEADMRALTKRLLNLT